MSIINPPITPATAHIIATYREFQREGYSHADAVDLTAIALGDDSVDQVVAHYVDSLFCWAIYVS